MNRFRIGLLLSASALMAPTLAVAQDSGPVGGWYASLGAGANYLSDGNYDGAGLAAEAEYDLGSVGLAAIGYSFGNFRVEGEFSARRNDVDEVNNPDGSGGGNVKAYALMGNVIYDVFATSAFSPYVGLGAGAARLDADSVASGGVPLLDDEDTVLAYQAMAGVRYALSRNFLLNADYRYFATLDPEYSTAAGDVDGEYRSHAVTVGFTYRFAPPPPPPAPVPISQPAPPPPPPPAPAPAAPPPPPPAETAPEVYIVFFAFDRADISPVAAQVLERAIADFRRTGSSSFEVHGYTDTSGPTAYNQRLSERRAAAVTKFLTDRGVQPGQISQRSFGETRLRVPTADGVREAENRRAEIRLQR